MFRRFTPLLRRCYDVHSDGRKHLPKTGLKSQVRATLRRLNLIIGSDSSIREPVGATTKCYAQMKVADQRCGSSHQEVLCALVVSAFLIALVFPDVIFRGASLRITDQLVGRLAHLTPKNVYPVPAHSNWWDAFYDTGGALFQSEPMIEFMRFCFQSGNSPFWNPYSGMGSLGSDSLVDQKFSLFTVVNALLGGGSLVYNVTLLASYMAAVFFLYLLLTQKLKLSPLAGVAAAIFYLLNGFSIANVGTNMIPGYLYGPAWLYFSICLADARSVAAFVGTAASFAILFSNSHVPVNLLTAASLYSIIIGYVISRNYYRSDRYRLFVRVLAIHAVAVLTGAICLSIVYVPVISNLASTGILTEYSKRIFQPAFALGIPSLFSPSLVYESYNATEPMALKWYPTGSIFGGPASVSGNVVYHFGIVSLLLIGCAWPRSRGRINPVIVFCMIPVLISLLRIFGIPGVDRLITMLPIMGSIAEDYWWAAIFIPAAILVGFGVNNLIDRSGWRWPCAVIAITGVLFTVARIKVFGLHEPFYSFKLASIIFLAVVTVLSLALCMLSSVSKNTSLASGMVFVLVGLMFAELTWDAKAQRFPRSDFFHNPSPEISFIKHNIGLYRTLNFGQSGLYPELGSAFQIAEASSINEGLLLAFKEFFYRAVSVPSDQIIAYMYTPKAFPHGLFPSLWEARDTPDLHVIDWNAIDLMGVKYLVLPSHFSNYRAKLSSEGKKLVFESSNSIIFENPDVLPRAFSIPVPDDRSSSSIQLPADLRGHISGAEIFSYRNTDLRIRGEANQPSLVVLSDNWQQGWRATVSGHPAPIVKVNEVFRGVFVPAGRFDITMSYRSTIDLVAKILSVAMVVILSSMMIFKQRVDDYLTKYGLR